VVPAQTPAAVQSAQLVQAAHTAACMACMVIVTHIGLPVELVAGSWLLQLCWALCRRRSGSAAPG
jgi:hypothetical protein